MENRKELLKPRGCIKGGAKLPHYKGTAGMQSSILPTPQKVTITMRQHIGAPCVPTVQKGDEVFVGTVIGNSDAFVSAPVHSSVSGTVSDVTDIKMSDGSLVKAVIIESDGNMTPDASLKPVKVETPADLAKAARDCGLVGLGGAGFPTHVKLTVSDDKPIDTLIVNGAECEPFITSDDRECIENPDDVMGGIYLIKDVLNIKNVIIGIESNKPEAIKVLYKIAADKRDTDNSVRLMKLKSKYPQGAEKVLIYTATKRKLAPGKLPADVGCIVMNVTSIASLYRYITTGMPLVKKRITVEGNAVKNPQNVIVPIGTEIKTVLDYCGAENYEKIILGGPMMGTAVYDTVFPILKQNNAILALKDKLAESKPITACIGCGRCVRACPMNLAPRPVEVAMESSNPNVEMFKMMNIMNCIECGSCAFSCPAGRPLVASMRLAKNEIRKAGNK